MRIVGMLVVALLCLWQPWSTATATPSLPRFETARAGDRTARCLPGYRKSTITARCVRNQARLLTLRWF